MSRAVGSREKETPWPMRENCRNQRMQDTKHPQGEMDKKHMKSPNIRH